MRKKAALASYLAAPNNSLHKAKWQQACHGLWG